MLSVLLLSTALALTPAQPLAEKPLPVAVDHRSMDHLGLALSDTEFLTLRATDQVSAVRSRLLIDPVPLPNTVEPGDEGWAVVRVQERLRALGVYRGEADGIYGRETAASVVALHKVLRVERSNEWTAEDWKRTEPLDHREILDRNPDQADRVEVDVSRQVMFVIREGEVAAVVPVSTGNGEKYWSKNGGTNGGYVRATTPKGTFTLFRHIPGWRNNYLGSLFKPWYFTPYYAIHGSRSVPTYPASHGCVRVPTWESNHLDRFLQIGLPVHIWEA